MIFHSIFKNTYSFVLLTRAYIIEYFDIIWLFEYDIEKNKFFFLLNKIKNLLNTKIKFNLLNTKIKFNLLNTKIKFNLLNTKIKFNFIYIMLVFVFNLFLFENFYYFNLFKNSFLYLIIIFFFYFFLTTYFHFSKTYFVNKYTTQTQRFWKRTFGTFWVLEFTLFFIYMYLTLISPAELPMYAINYKEIITGVNITKNSNYHFFFFFIIICLNFIYISLIFLKKKNNKHSFNLILFFLNLMYCYILYYEFLKFYYVAGWGTHSVYITNKSIFLNHEYNNLINNNLDYSELYFKTPSYLNNSWNEYSYEKQWLRTFRHFLYILLILKFWHIFLIYLYFCLSLIKFLETNYLSFDSISSNHQNSIYIVWFYLFSYILVIKKKLYFILIIMYDVTYTHINFIDVFNCFLNEMNFKYLL